MTNKNNEGEFDFVDEDIIDQLRIEEFSEEEASRAFAHNFLSDYRHENVRGDKRPYYPKENSRGWVGTNQCDYFVTYSIPEDGGRTAVASFWVEDVYGHKTLVHYDLGKLLSPILQYETNRIYSPASFKESHDEF